jgi:protein-S-isoprenylcysteine O-methyltransferase Ste14
MPKEMTKWGVGPRFLIYSVLYGVPIIAATIYFYPLFQISVIPYHILASVGAILILIGIPFYIISLVSVMRAFKAGHLVTNGVYGMCRHPIYSAWVVFFVPGIVLLINTWIGFSVPVVMYFILQALVKEEDQYLEKTFGEEYLAYKRKIPAVLPIGWLS